MSTDKENKSSLPFAERLTSERKRLTLTQRDAAAKCSVSREMWGRYERGDATPGVDILEDFCSLGGDPNFLLGKAPDTGDDLKTAVAVIDELCAQLGIYKYEQEMWQIGDQLLKDRLSDWEMTKWVDTPRRRRSPQPPVNTDVRGSVLMRALLLKSPVVIDDETRGRLRDVIEALEYELQDSGKSLSPRAKSRAVIELWVRATEKGRLFTGMNYDVKEFVRGLP